MITKSDLHYAFPEELIATQPVHPPRVLRVQDGKPQEISFAELLAQIPAGDLLVINETRVEKRRVFARIEGGDPATEIEILFHKTLPAEEARAECELWEVLFPARAYKLGQRFELPGSVMAELAQKGLPQALRVSKKLNEAYFSEFGEMPLPPYIQKARSEQESLAAQGPGSGRHSQAADDRWYQTAWAKNPGSSASPTASLHFSEQDVISLKKRGVFVAPITLHVGLGTFLPLQAEKLTDHKMHSEVVHIEDPVWKLILDVKASGHRVWALGTTAARALESQANNMFQLQNDCWSGDTNLFIHNNYEWKMVDCLLTNFHQPESTLLAMVMSFAGREVVLRSYEAAIEKKFRLFSYGDLSAWIK